MPWNGTSIRSTGQRLSDLLTSLDQSPRVSYALGWVVLIIGLAAWTATQTLLAVFPLWERAVPPEPDDTFTYVLKTVQMEECFYQDCPALEDLRNQFATPTSDRTVASERSLAWSRIFPVYHPLFSAFLLALTHFGPDPTQAYKIVWTAGPLFFGIAFAYLLSVLFGRAVAGIALLLLACKVFPDTGLTYVVPSNICMGLAVMVWARIIARRGDAPWTLALGSVLLVGVHTVGRIYTVIAAAIALAVSRQRRSLRLWLPVAFSLVIVVAVFVLSSLIKRPSFVAIAFFPPGPSPFAAAVLGAAQSLVQEIAEIIRLEGGLFGSIPLFSGAVVFGYLTMERDLRREALRFIVLYTLFLVAAHFYRSDHAADVILRIWIPLVVVMFGAVAQGIRYAFVQCGGLLAERLRGSAQRPIVDIRNGWPVVALAILVGYSFSMVCYGGEQIWATARYVRDREPLSFNEEQPRLLLGHAAPGDKVLYTSMIAMPYYFIHGAMKLGAVYYHRAMANEPLEKALLGESNLRFAVTYNPTMYHPSFEGLQEHQWWITSPDFRFSPLSRPRRSVPISYEGMIQAARFRWIDVASTTGPLPANFRVLVKNPGAASTITIVPLGADGRPMVLRGVTESLPQSWFGWIHATLDMPPNTEGIRIVLPDGNPEFSIGGMVFGDTKLHWPWEQKAELTTAPRDCASATTRVSFDYARILPEPLHAHTITVLDDSGSSVLFRIDPRAANQ